MLLPAHSLALIPVKYNALCGIHTLASHSDRGRGQNINFHEIGPLNLILLTDDSS